MKSEISLQSLVLTGLVPAKARLFAMPVLIHPQLIDASFPMSPALPNFAGIFEHLKGAMTGTDGQQSYMVLDRIVSPSFLGSVLWEGEDAMTNTLVSGHALEQEDPYFTVEDLILDDAITGSKGIIGFIVGAIYRQDEDPTELTLIDPHGWQSSYSRQSVENILSGGSQSPFRHRVLSPLAFDDALIAGFEGLCQMYLHMHGGASVVEADLLNDGAVALRVTNGPNFTEFIIGPQTLPIDQVEMLLKRINSNLCSRQMEPAMDGYGEYIFH